MVMLIIINLSNNLFEIKLFELELAEQFKNAEKDVNGAVIPPSWLIQAFTGVPNTNGFLITGITSANLLVDIYKSTFNDFTPETVMDFGCGCGRILRAMPQDTGIKYYGVDLHKMAIEWLKMSHPEMHFLNLTR